MSSNVETKGSWEENESVTEAIEGLRQQEKDLLLKRFDAKVAFDIGSAVFQSLQTSEFQSSSALISIRTWDGMTLYQAAHGRVDAMNEDWIRRKCNSVRSYKKSSFLVGRELVSKGRDINSLPSDFAAHGGAFPIRIQGGAYDDPIGAIVVSGLKQWQDHDLVARAIAAVNQKL